MNAKQCEGCPFLGSIFKHYYGTAKEAYCEYAPAKLFMRKVSRMKTCPKTGNDGN